MPVIGYGRSDRAQPPRSNGSSPSEPAPVPSSTAADISAGSPPANASTLLNRLATWSRSENSTNATSARRGSAPTLDAGKNAAKSVKAATKLANATAAAALNSAANASRSATQLMASANMPLADFSAQVPQNTRSTGPGSPAPSSHSSTASAPTNPPPSSSGINIADYCLGTPRKVGQSHAGAVELYLCTQENAVFLPPARKTHRRRQRYTNHEETAASSDNYDHPNVNGENPTLTRSETRDSDFLGVADPSSTDVSPGDRPDSSSGRLSSDQNSSDDARVELGPHETFTTTYGSLDMHSGGIAEELASSCATLRGSVLMKISKPTKIKEVGVNFFCLSRTLWNLLSQSSVLADSTLPNNAQVEDTAYLGIHHWDFVPLEQFGTAQSQYDKGSGSQSSTLIGQDLYGADVAVLKDQPQTLQHRKFSRIYNSQACRVRGGPSYPMPVFGPLKTRPRKLKPNSVASDGVLFPAGSYVYNFALLIDEKTPGSIHVPNGQVKFVLSARVVRTGAFNMNVSGQIEVDVVRAPPDASSEGAVFGPTNDAILLSRVWNDRFVYSLEIDRRNLTQDVPTRMTLSVLPLNSQTNADIRLHQVQVYALETVTYVYSLDPTIRYVDPDLKLLLFQKDAAGDDANEGNLLRPTDVTTIQTNLTMVSEHHPQPHRAAQQPFQRGRYGEMRFIEPDVKGPYITVRHRLMLVMRVSRPGDDGARSHYEVKIDTPITVQSRHCVSDNIRLPTYIHSEAVRSESPDAPLNRRAPELPPSFDDAMGHELLGPSGTDSLPRRGDKAVHDVP